VQITDVKIRKFVDEERIKAYASIVIDGVIAVHDMKIIESKEDGHLYIAMPYRKTSQGKSMDIIHPINQETREELETAIISKYLEAVSLKK
jgi:stage V sporulation protein G